MKRSLSILLCLLLLAGLLPAAAFATAPTAPASLTIDGTTYTDLSADLAGSGWEWNAGEVVLTLAGYDGGPIAAAGDLTINTYASNSVSAPEGCTEPGISATGDLCLLGFGDLYVTTEDDAAKGIYAAGDLLLGDDAIGFRGKLVVLSGFDGLYAVGNIRFSSVVGDVYIDAGGDGIYSDNGSFTASYLFGDLSVYAERNGINTYGDITFDDDVFGKVVVRADKRGLWSYNGSSGVILGGYGDYTIISFDDAAILAEEGNVTVSGSGHMIIGTEAESSAAVYLLTSGKQLILGADSPEIRLYAYGTGSKAVYNSGDAGSPVTDNGSSTVSGAAEDSYVEYKRFAISALTVGGTDLTAGQLTVDQSGTGWSWDADEQILTLSGYNGGPIASTGDLSIVTAEGSDNTVASLTTDDAIYVYHGSLNLSGDGDLTLRTTNTNNGIFVALGNADIHMSGDLTIDTTATNDGIYADYDISVYGSGKVKIHAKERCCYSQYGSVELTGSGDLDLTGSNDTFGAVYAGGCGVRLDTDADVTISAKSDALCGMTGVDIGGEGDVTLTSSNGNGIFAPLGSVSISKFDGTLTVDAKLDAIYGHTSVTCSGGLSALDLTADLGCGMFAEYGDFFLLVSGTFDIASKNHCIGAPFGRASVHAMDETNLTSSVGSGICAQLGVTVSVWEDLTVDGVNGIVCTDGDIRMDNLGPVTVTADENAVWLGTASSALLLQGWGAPLRFTAGDGYAAVYCDADGSSPVIVDDPDYYDLVTGAPNTVSLVYDHTEPVAPIDTPAVITPGYTVPEDQVNHFADVNAGDYFYDAVRWADKNGIAKGVAQYRFAPNEPTTRAQMVTFLWRAAGCPEPAATVCKFTDADADAYYYKALLWAVGQCIAEGTSATKFSPDAPVTRAQAVTFLWRYECSMQYSTMTADGPAASPFTDIAADAYYYNAVLWAKAKGITDGVTATRFAPNEGCTRAQIVTFLYRDLVK